MNMGMAMPSWYDIVGLDERSNENCAGIAESQARIAGILDQEHADTGLPYDRMVLAGFSQGGALSLYTGMQLPEKLAAVVVMSGYLPHASAFQVQQPSVPVWHGHGTQDMVVRYSLAEKSRDAVVSKGAENYTVHKYPIAHTVSPEEIGDVLQFLLTRIPDDATCRIKLQDPAEMSVKELKVAIRKAGLTSQSVGLMEKFEFVKLLQDHRAK
jgi:predicted esterase